MTGDGSCFKLPGAYCAPYLSYWYPLTHLCYGRYRRSAFSVYRREKPLMVSLIVCHVFLNPPISGTS